MMVRVRRELERSASTVAAIDEEQVLAIAEALVRVFRSGNKVVIFGNGGSAADAQHLAAEFSGRFMWDRPALSAIAINNVSAITAIGNDYSFDGYLRATCGWFGAERRCDHRHQHLWQFRQRSPRGAPGQGAAGRDHRFHRQQGRFEAGGGPGPHHTFRAHPAHPGRLHGGRAHHLRTGGEDHVQPSRGVRGPGRHPGQGRPLLLLPRRPPPVPWRGPSGAKAERGRVPGHRHHQPVGRGPRVFLRGGPGRCAQETEGGDRKGWWEAGRHLLLPSRP